LDDLKDVGFVFNDEDFGLSHNVWMVSFESLQKQFRARDYEALLRPREDALKLHN
jgi:hypothetical protein